MMFSLRRNPRRNRRPVCRRGTHHAPRRLQAEWLEARLLLAAVPENLAWQLRELVAAQATAPLVGPALPSASSAANAGALFQVIPSFAGPDLVDVRIWTRAAPAELVEPLGQLGLELQGYSGSHRLLEGRLPVPALAAAASLPGVLSITPAYRPLTRTGAVTSLGDEILNADEARALGFDGSGVKVGVLSDSVDRVGGGLASSIATGDLPGAGNPLGNTTPVQVLRDFLGDPYFTDFSDEGRAMLEIVHDLAPQAELAFHSAWYGQSDFANGIRLLAQAGCDVIVDDVIYFDEPWFQDGMISQAINEVADEYGVTYVTAAGNDEGSVHAALYRDVGGWHDFDSSDGVDTTLRVTVPAGYWNVLILQWSDPWYTTDGVTSDFDVELYNLDGSLAGSYGTDNLATQQPMEYAQFRGHPYVNVDFDVKIRRTAGSGPEELKLWSVSGALSEWATGASALAHAGAERAIAVGAVPAYAPETIEPFSSTGPVYIYFDPAGLPLPSPDVRYRPDVVATDQANTTFFGQDIPEDSDTFPNFAGTSASAPHVAAVAALLLDANDRLAPEQVRELLADTAADLGTAGWDGQFGQGRVDALAAVQLAPTIPDTSGPGAIVLSPPARTPRHVRFARLQFSESLAPDAATHAANYELVGAGGDGQFGTPDDLSYAVVPAYDAVHHQVQLGIAGPVQGLPWGRYRLTAAVGITDESGNPLNDGAAEVFSFQVLDWMEPTLVPGVDGLSTVLVDVNGDGRAAMGLNRRGEPGLILYDENDALVTGPVIVDDPYDGGVTDVEVAPDGQVVILHTDRWAQTACILYASRFSADGSFLGRSQVSTSDSIINNPAAVTLLPGGEFAVTFRVQVWYPGSDVFIRVFHADGSPKGDPVQIAPTGSILDNPQVAADSAGNVTAIWERNASGSTPNAVREMWARRFDRNGVPLGDPFLLFTTSGGSRHLTPALGMAPDGNFLVAWNEGDAYHGGSVYAGRFSAEGSPQGAAFLVAQNGLSPVVSVNDAGQVLVGWRGIDSSGAVTGHAYARRYAADGSAVGEPFEIAASTSTPSLAIDRDSSFLAAWAVDGFVYRKWFVEPLPDLADLQVAASGAPEAATIGEHIELHSTLYNHGITGAASFQVQYYLSPDPQITGTGNDRALLASPASLAAMWGGTSQANTSYTIVPADFAPGSYWLGVIADVGNAVAEEDETNNAAAIPIELAAAPAKTGPEFLANASTSGDQNSPCVVTAPDGTYAVLWSGKGVGDDQGIFLQRFSAAQEPLGPEQRVNQTIPGSESNPAVTADAQGNFLVVWIRWRDANMGQVVARRYDTGGVPREDEWVVSDISRSGSIDASLYKAGAALAADGGFVVTWNSLAEVYVRLFDAQAVPRGDAFPVSTSTGSGRTSPAVAMVPSGKFLITWLAGGLQYRVFAGDGTPLGDEQTLDAGWEPVSIAQGPDGRVLLAWRYLVDGYIYSGEIHGQWFSADLTPLGTVFTVNSYTQDIQHDPHVSALGDAGFLVTWVSPDANDYGLYGQRYAADGRMIGGEWLINSFTTGAQDSPSAAGWSQDSFVVAWRSSSQDGSGSGVFGQVFGGPAVGAGDLMVSEIRPLQGSYESQAVPVSAVYVNRGPSDLGKFACQYYLSADRTITADDIPLSGPFEVAGLAAWQSSRDSRTLTLPERLGGVFYLGLVVDTAGEVTELYEDNNVLVSAEPGVVGPLSDGLGTELRWNETTSGDQLNPVVARQPDGSLLAVWEGKGPGDDYGIFLRRLDAAGQPLSAEILVNTYTTGTQGQPEMALDDLGNFVVVWESAAQDGSGYGIFGQRFSAAVAPLGAEFAVNTITANDQRYPDVAMDPQGNFTVVWPSAMPSRYQYTVCFRQFAADGTPLAEEREAPGGTASAATPKIGMAGDGRFAVVWRENSPDTRVLVQRFAPDGSASTGAIQVNTIPAGVYSSPNEQPTIAMSDTGECVVAWLFRQNSIANVYARRYAADGTPRGDQFLVSSNVASDQADPQVSVNEAGGLAFVWTSNGQDGSGWGVYGKRFAADGSSLEGEFTIPTTTLGTQQQPFAAAFGGDGIVVVWSGQNVDGSGYAVCAQLVDAPAAGPSAAQSPPYTEGFEAGDLAALAGWQFTQTGSGTWQVSNVNGPHTDAYHLQAGQTAADASVQEAVLKLDLSAVATRTDLELDFWIQHLAAATSRLRLSGDGGSRSWTFGYLIHPVAVGQYEHSTFDLDALLRTAGIALDEDVYFKFSHVGSGSAQVMTLDDVRVDDEDVFGPRVVSQNPVGAIHGPISELEVTFDEPLDVATFTTADVTLAGPAGTSLTLAGAPVDSGDHCTFRIPLAAPWVTGGNFVLTIGIDVRDPEGNPLNQDADFFNGETNGQDRYESSFQILATPALSLPHPEGFESGVVSFLPEWTIARTVGTIEVAASDPHTGQYALRTGYGSSTGSTAYYQDAILHVDLFDDAGQAPLSGVTLDFWVGNAGAGLVSVSVDGTTWVTPSGGSITGGSSYQHYAFDLDALGLVYSDDVQIRFRHYNYSAGYAVWDDIHVATGRDVSGPRLLSQCPVGTAVATALRFDGVDDRLIASYTPPVNNFTLVARFRTSATHQIDTESTSGTGGTSGQRYLFGPDHRGSNGGAGVSVGSNGISVYELGDFYMPALAVYQGEIGTGYVHVVVTYTNKQPRIYLNGQLVRTGLMSTRSTVYAPTSMGSSAFAGDVDEVAIYDRPLSLEEIQTLVNTPPVGHETGLLAAWNFDETCGSQWALDRSPNLNHARLGSTDGVELDDPVRPVDGPVTALQLTFSEAIDAARFTAADGALNFDGTDDRLVASYTPPVDNFTFAARFRTSVTHQIDGESTSGTGGTTGQRYLFWPASGLANGGAGVSVGTNGISVYEAGDYYMPALAVYQGAVGTDYVHLAVTYTNKQPRIYLNGQLVRTGLTSPRATVYAPTIVGGGSYGWFAGDVDDVVIFNRPLSLEEIQALVNTPPVGTETGLVAAWDFSEMRDSQVALDRSPNQAHAQLGSSSSPDAADPLRFLRDVTIREPGGSVLSWPASNAIEDSGDQRTFTVHFAEPQSLAGSYSLSVGPDVRDSAGNVMNQNGDALQGDGCSGSLVVNSAAAGLPVIEGFETGRFAAVWSAVRNAGVVRIGTTSPLDGSYAAELSSTAGSSSYYQDLLLHLDLLDGTVAETDAVLEFWLKEINGGGRSDDLSVSVSADGNAWTTLATIAGSSSWQRFAYNLSSLPLTLSDDVQVKFHHNSYYAGSFALDNVRVQPNPPSVVAHWPSGEVAPGAAVLRFDFDEPMDSASFSLGDDVPGFDGPAGDLRDQLTGFSWLDSDTLEVTFAAQLAPGRYHLDLGPGLLDPAGKPLDQDGDGIWGEAGDDVYRACFTVTGDLAVQFDGSNDLVAVPDSASLRMTGSLTMEAWIFATGAGSGSGGAGGIIINKEGEYEVARFADGTIQYALATAQNQWTPWVNTGYVVPLAAWAHVAVTGADGIWRTYVDGDLVHTWSGPSSLGDAIPAQNELRIGGRMVVSQCFRGLIDDARVWNYARTQEEIRAGLNGGLTGSEPGLAGAWNFDELPVDSQTVLDLSPYRNDGTLGATAAAASDDPLRIARDHTPEVVTWQVIEDSGYDSGDAITSDVTPVVTIQFSEAVLGQTGDVQVRDPFDALVSPLEVQGWGTCRLTLRFGAPLTSEGWYRIALNAAGIHDVTLNALEGGAELPLEFVLDLTPPRVAGTDPAAIKAAASTPGPVTQIVIDWTEELNPLDGAAPANYELRRAVNGAFDDADDVVYALAPSYMYEAGTLTSRTTLDPGLGGAPLPFGEYRMTVFGNLSSALHDLAGNLLDGDADGAGGPDYVRIFTVTETLIVEQFSGTATGFVAGFNRALEPSVLNLYDGAGGTRGPADVVLRKGAGAAVAGSIVAEEGGQKIRFVATGSPLAPDVYSVTLTSGAAALRDPAGSVLDGDRDWIPGGDFTAQFTVAALPVGTRCVSLPDFARGAGQTVNVPTAAIGLPIRIDHAEGVTSLAVDLVYDEDLLEIAAATLAAGLPGDWTVALDAGTAGVAKITASGATALSGTDVEVVRLTATVPGDAPYGASQAIRLENVSLDGGAIAAVGDVAVHKGVYLGDADGSGVHSSADAFLTVQAALGLAGGFAAHAWTDPRIVGDADGSGVLSAADAFLIVQEGLGLAEPFVPDNPHITLTHVGGGVDPQFRIDVNLPAVVGGLVSVPVQLAIEPAATNVGAFDFDLFFDPARLTIQVPDSVSAGADTAGWAVSAVLVASGHLRVGMVTSTGQPLAPGLREIARLQFGVEAGESSRMGFQPVPDGSETRPTLLPPITDYRSPITDRLDGSETHPTVLDIEPVDARAGGYTWTGADGSVLIRPAQRTLAGATRERVWRDVDAEAELLESVLADLVHEIASAWR